MSYRVLWGITGSVAAVKTPEVFRALCDAGCDVKIAATSPALTFFDAAPLRARRPPSASEVGLLSGSLFLDSDEWPVDRLFSVGEPVLHIELRKWADLLLIAPLDANTLAKLALGLCDNLLTCIYRAWDFSRPVVLAPAMNTMMWEHPATARHLRQMCEDHEGIGIPGPRARGMSAVDAALNDIRLGCPRLRIAGPVSKRLACGDEGIGGMASVAEIVEHVLYWEKSPNS